MVKTTRGQASLDRLVEAIPDRVFRKWRSLSISVMSVLLFLWVLIGIGFLLISLWWCVDLLHELATEGIQMDLQTSTESSGESVSVGEVVIGLLRTVILLPIAILILATIMLVISLPLFPGLVFHEFGHYTALRKADVEVRSYGLLFSGPVLNGAFVQPETEKLEDKNVTTQFGVLAGGIFNNLLYGTVLLALSLLLFHNPVATITAGYGAILEQPVPAILFTLGCIEYLMGIMNAIPVGPVDGGKFAKLAEAKRGEGE